MLPTKPIEEWETGLVLDVLRHYYRTRTRLAVAHATMTQATFDNVHPDACGPIEAAVNSAKHAIDVIGEQIDRLEAELLRRPTTSSR